MKPFLSSLVAAAILLFNPDAGFAAKGTAASAPAFKGKITAVNVKAHTITLTQKKTGKSETISVRHASITVDKQPHKHLADLKVGMKARVKHGRNGRIEVAAKTHSAKKKKKPVT